MSQLFGDDLNMKADSDDDGLDDLGLGHSDDETAQ